jgi:hypothetical protein
VEDDQQVRAAEPDSWGANPEVEFRAGFELVALHQAGEAKRRNGTSLLTSDEVHQLLTDYGDGSKFTWIRVAALGDVRCGRNNDPWVMIWDWNRDEPPTERQFDWWERFHNCFEQEEVAAKRAQAVAQLRGLKPSPLPKREDVGFSKRVRDIMKKEHQVARKDAEKQGAKGKTFRDRIVDLVSKTGGTTRKGSSR